MPTRVAAGAGAGVEAAVAAGTAARAAVRTDHLIAPDGVSLVRHRLAAPGLACGTAFVAHGQAHHTLSMLPTLEGLAARGWDVHGTDMRGHGHSVGPRAPHAHMEIGEGWERLVADMRQALGAAFDGVPWERRLVVAPNLGALLVLEVLKTWPDLASRVVLVAPPSDQPAVMRLARGFMRVRARLHASDHPDELALHQLYSFLGGQLRDRERLVDVVSADERVTDALLADEWAWPTPTTGYFHEMFRGIESAWRWPAEARVREGTRVLILYGGDDPVTSNGRFVAPMQRRLEAMGIEAVDERRVEGGRGGLILDERTLGVSALIADWCAQGSSCAAPPPCEGNEPARSDEATAPVGASVLVRMGLEAPVGELDPDELVELCYRAIDDDAHWVEMLYRVFHALEARDDLPAAQVEAILDALVPHWDRSFRIGRQARRMAALGAVLENVIDRFRIGMAIVTPDLDVSYANGAFVDALGQLGGAAVEARNTGSVLRDLTDRAFRERAAVGDAVWVLDGQAVGFHFRPRALKQTALRRGGEAGVLILRASGDGEGGGAGANDRLELLQLAYGLTTKEAEAAIGLLDGRSPEAISQSLDVSIHTVRTHLRRVYEKVDVQGQNELTARLLGGPLGLLPAGASSAPSGPNGG